MLKFLRKYNTLILVVGGSLLMVVFLVPQAIQQIGQNADNLPYAQVEGEVLSQQHFRSVADDWQNIGQIMPEAIGVMQIENPDHWMLLLHEANKYGLVGGPTDGALSMSYFADYAARASLMQFMQTNPWMFQTNEAVQQALQTQTDFYRNRFQQNLEARTSTGASELQYYQSLAKLRGVARLLETYNSLAGNSIPEIQLAGADLYDRVTVDLGVIPASAFRPDPSSLSDEDVQAHFEAYRNIEPGEGEFGFGYLLPDAVKYEWIRVNSSVVMQSLSTDPADVYEHYRRNTSQYGSQSYEEVRDRVRSDYLNSIARQRIDSIASAIGRERLRAAQSLAVDGKQERYRIIPDDHAGPSLETYAEVAREASGLEGDAAEGLVTITPATDAFLSRRDIATSPLGATRYEITAREFINMPDLLLSAKEFGGDERTDLQRGLLFGPVINPVGGGVKDLVFVRITDVRHEGPANSVEEIEDRVREDLATLRGYEELSQRAETFREAFADGGLSWFNSMDFAGSTESQQHLDVVVGTNTVQTSTGDGLTQLSETAFPEGVIEKARKLDPMQPMEDQSSDARTAGVLMPSNLSLGLATIKSFRPTTSERLREGMSLIEQRVTQEARGLSTEAPYSFEALSRRLGFERLDRSEEDSEG